jgi:hypothetical protein
MTHSVFYKLSYTLFLYDALRYAFEIYGRLGVMIVNDVTSPIPRREYEISLPIDAKSQYVESRVLAS